jgi:aspartate aminotransferase-like enzyme
VDRRDDRGGIDRERWNGNVRHGMEGKKRIFTPGPTEVPPQVLGELSKPLIHHRTDGFRELHRRLEDGLQQIFGTADPVLILTSSGTGAMEAAVSNITVPGDTVLVTPCGKFGERWGELARTYGLSCVTAAAEWGKPITAEQIAGTLDEHPEISVVFTTHVETSTGVRMDLEPIARTVREHDALIVVDGITGLCAERVRSDEWGLDAVIGGSQKGFGVPPGISFISLSERAQERVRTRGHPVYYFDLAKGLDALERGDTAYTPAISLFAALGIALDLILQEGLDAVIERHGRNAAAVRAAVEALGLTLFSQAPCNATTAVVPLKGTAPAIISCMDESYGVRIAGGQGKLKGNIFRLGHLGFYDRTDMFTMISALEGALRDCNIADRMGVGVAAALNSFERHT